MQPIPASSFDLGSLVRIPGGARMRSPDVVSLAAGEPGLYVARPQVIFRPDVALVYGPRGARARIVQVKFREKDGEITPRDVIEPPAHQSLASASLERFEQRTIEPSGFLELVVQNQSDRRVDFTPIFLGIMAEHADGVQRTAMAAYRTIDALDGIKSFTVPGEEAPPMEGKRPNAWLEVPTLLRWETTVRALEITTDAEPGELWVSDLKVGTDSQLPSPNAWPVELFAKPLRIDTERAFPGVTTTLQIVNRSREPRSFSFAFYVEPPTAPPPDLSAAVN